MRHDSKFSFGQVLDELAGTGRRTVIVLGVAFYDRKGTTSYYVEDVEPESMRGSRWVDENWLQPLPSSSDAPAGSDAAAGVGKMAVKDGVATAVYGTITTMGELLTVQERETGIELVIAALQKSGGSFEVRVDPAPATVAQDADAG